MFKIDDIYKILQIIFLIFCILVFTGQALASLPTEIKIPENWTELTVLTDTDVLGSHYAIHYFQTDYSELPYNGNFPVVTKLAIPGDLNSETVILDETELKAVTYFAYWYGISERLTPTYDFLYNQPFDFDEIYEAYSPDVLSNVIFVLDHLLFKIALAFSGGDGLLSVGTLLSIGPDLISFINAINAPLSDNPGFLRYVLQGAGDVDPTILGDIESSLGVSLEEYIQQGSTILYQEEMEISDLLLSCIKNLEYINSQIDAAVDPILMNTSYGEVALNNAVNAAFVAAAQFTVSTLADYSIYDPIQDSLAYYNDLIKQGNLHAGVGKYINESAYNDLVNLHALAVNNNWDEFIDVMAKCLKKMDYLYKLHDELWYNIYWYSLKINEAGSVMHLSQDDLDLIETRGESAGEELFEELDELYLISQFVDFWENNSYPNFGFDILPSGGDPSCTTTTTWGVSGTVADGNGNGILGASVNVFLEGYSQSWGSDVTDSNGNYSISNISAPAKGSYTITIETTSGGTTGTNSTQTLTVTKVEEGHDLSLEGVNGGFSVDPMSITPGGACNLIVERITNKGEYPEEFDLIFELKYPNGSLCASKSKHLSLNAGISLTNQSETLFSDSSESGNYIAMVRIDCPYDINPEDNQRSLSVYVGQIQNYTQYKGDYLDCYPEDPVMVYGDYQLDVYSMMTGYFWANVLKNNNVIASNVKFDRYVPHYFDGNQLLVFCEMSEIQYSSAYMGTPNTVPFTYNPSTPHFPQGMTGDLTVISNTGEDIRSFGDEDIILTDDVSYVRNWYIGENGQYDYMVRHFKIPVDQSVGTYTVWFDDSIEQQQYHYLKKLDFVIEKGHDAFVNSISTKVGGVEKTEFDIGEDVTITANVGVSGGYTEEVNVVLSITGPNSYYYPDSKDRIESKATIGSTSQDIAFDSWNTSGLMPGNYTITVTANMGADINSGNNTKTKAVVIKELPALIVNGQTDKTTYDQGEQIELTATVTDPNTSPVNDATVTATITWPDLTESNPALSYSTSSGKYEYNFNAPQFGSYTIELRAVKTNYGTGIKELPVITVINTPPDTTINNVVPSEGQTINSSSVIFSWTGSDSGTPVHHLAYSWKLDQGTYSDFSTNTIIELNGLSDDPHIFYVKAFDGVLEDQTPAQRSFIVAPEPPEVYLSKTANKTTVTSGEVVTYTITYDNDGAGPAKNAIIEDMIPANTTYEATSASSGNVIHTGNVVVEVKVNGTWEADSASPSGEVTTVRWTFDSDIAVDDGDNYGTAEDESPNINDTDAGTVTLQVTID